MLGKVDASEGKERDGDDRIMGHNGVLTRSGIGLTSEHRIGEKEGA